MDYVDREWKREFRKNLQGRRNDFFKNIKLIYGIEVRKEKILKSYPDGIVYDTPIDGIFQVHWPAGNLRYEWEYKDGKRADGESKGWHPSGNLKQIRNWKDGKEDGLHTEWFDSGQMKIEETYKNGYPDGLYTKWYENGQKKMEERYHRKPDWAAEIPSVNDGLWINWTEDGKLSSERIYKDGKLISTKTRDFCKEPNTCVCGIHNPPNKEDGIIDGNGNRIDGWFRRYWKNGNLRYEWEYKDGKQVGVSKGWWPNGNLKQTRTLKNGIWNGLWTSWYENGFKEFEGTYKNGKKDGLSTWRFDDGHKRRETTYKDGKRDGKWIDWHLNRKKA